jgi:hypothetical protein
MLTPKLLVQLLLLKVAYNNGSYMQMHMQEVLTEALL